MNEEGQLKLEVGKEGSHKSKLKRNSDDDVQDITITQSGVENGH